MEQALLLQPDMDRIAARYPGFTSFKTRTAIHYRARWIRDALIQCALDPETLELGPSSTPLDELPPPAEFAFRRRTAIGLSLVLVCQVDTDIGNIIADHRVTVITRPEFNREPLRSTARAIWAHKRQTVDASDRYRAVDAVSKRGAAAMHEVISALKDQSTDPVNLVCSLVANSYLSMDPVDGIGPWSILRLGPAVLPGG